MKKTITIIAGTTLIAATSMMAMPTLDNQVNNLQLKLQRVKKINTLKKAVKSQQGQIDELTKQLKDTSIQLSLAKEKIKSSQVQIGSLQGDNATLRSLKAQLEKSLINTQSNLNSSYKKQIDNIQTANKDKLISLLNEYKSNKSDLQSKIADLSQKITEQDKTIQDFKDKVATDQSTQQALNSTIDTLTNQNKELEEKLSANQKETIAKYKAQIDQINRASQERINDVKNQYAKLSDKNNNELLSDKSDLETKLEAKKKILREQLEALISTVNSRQDKLYRAAQYIADCSDKIGSAVATLKKAYQNVGSPYPKRGFMGKMLASAGLEKTNPSWQTITDQNNQIRDNILTLREVSDSLSKDSLNSKELLKENQQDDGSFLGLF